MSSAWNRRLRSIGLRLTAWYFVVFCASTMLLALAASYLVQSSVHRKIVATVAARLSEQRAAFDNEGLAGVKRLAETRRRAPGLQYIRVASRADLTVFEHREDPSLSFEPETVSVFATQEVRTIRARSDGSQWTLGTAALSDGQWLQVAISDDETRDIVGHLRAGMLGVWIGAIVLGLIAGFLLTRRALRPIARLTSTARQVIASGDLSLRVPERGSGDELDELSRLFNAMLGRNQSLVGGMREALDNVAHDLRTPLTRLRTGAEVALREASGLTELREALAGSIEESEQVLSMLKTLMDISEAETGVMKLERTDVDLSDLARNVVELYEHVADERGVRLSTHISAGVCVSCDRNRIHQALANLVDNAVKYTPPGGWVAIRATREEKWACVDVEDSGVGIAAKDLPRIWQRLYRADSSRSERGLGLGLSFVKAIVEAHGGAVEVQSQSGQGSRFRIRLRLG